MFKKLLSFSIWGLVPFLSLVWVFCFLIVMATSNSTDVQAKTPPPLSFYQYKIDSDKITVFTIPHPTKSRDITCVYANFLDCDFGK